MSNIYVQEPPTSGKVLLRTSVGHIDIELWSKECPKACRNFIQLCMEGYYDNTLFFRVVKGFIVQGGDPKNDGTGGESIYGEPFKDEFHQRLRFTRRGLLGMANSGPNDNGSQFFFTFAAAAELNNENTLFGKVSGDTIFNMLKLEDGLVDHNERPMYPHKIISTEILHNPFTNIVPRHLKQKVHKENQQEKRKREKGVKNFKLLSFGAEAEEDEEETNEFVQQNVGKAKSLHDVVDDPNLSKDTYKKTAELQGDCEIDNVQATIKAEAQPTNESRIKLIKEKLKSKTTSKSQKSNVVLKKDKAAKEIETYGQQQICDKAVIKQEIESDSDEDVLKTIEQEIHDQNLKKKEQIRSEIKQLKKDYQDNKRAKEQLLIKVEPVKELKTNRSSILQEDHEYVRDYLEAKQTYCKRQEELPKKGAEREAFTLQLLSKFRAKLEALHESQADTDLPQQPRAVVNDEMVEKEIQSDAWLAHTLRFEDAEIPVQAKDASTKSDNWYDVYDPRNPINKRKRSAGGKTHAKSDSKKVH